eukprot:scaffold324306_cov98-Tisochrysis_lutea.AAC.1
MQTFNALQKGPQSYVGGGFNVSDPDHVRFGGRHDLDPRTDGPEFVWSEFVSLAQALSYCGESGCVYGSGAKTKYVYAIDQGGVSPADAGDNGCWKSYCSKDIAPAQNNKEDKGNTLIIFLGAGTVCLTETCRETSDKIKWGPSVLAPFARVVLGVDVGHFDGCL